MIKFQDFGESDSNLQSFYNQQKIPQKIRAWKTIYKHKK